LPSTGSLIEPDNYLLPEAIGKFRYPAASKDLAAFKQQIMTTLKIDY